MQLIAAKKVTVKNKDGKYIKYRTGQPVPDADKIPNVDVWIRSGHLMKEGDPGAPKLGEKFGQSRTRTVRKNKFPSGSAAEQRASIKDEVRAELKAEAEAKPAAKPAGKPASKPSK